ncbi:MAG TPA: FHA domain-containing protein [Ktedonobacteraceae bacterium]|nr:FHA domain-containing protein [Ktedonobacteraceae bacterium]
MDARFYNSEEIDIERLANDLENIYRVQGYQVQQLSNGNQVMVQLKKGGDLEALIGLQAALSVILQRTGGGVVAMIGQQKWVDKAAVGAVGLVAAPILWPLMLTAGAGAIRQASLGNQVLNAVDSLIRQQYPNVRLGPIPVQIMPMIQQQWAPPPPQYLPPPQVPQYIPPASNVVNALPSPASAKLRCPTCNTPYEEGDTFCSGCGRTLKTLCPNCKTEIKPGVAFCPKCGASTFQGSSAAQATILPSTSTPAPTIPAYTPPVAPKPPAQQKPPTPVYTPPKPAPQPEPQPYVPPTPQQPPVMPKPTVTMIPGAPKPETPPAPQQPKKPSVPVYTPPVHPQPVQPAAPTVQTNVSPTSQTIPARKPILPKPASQSSFDPNAVWGTLTFSDGREVRLAGERAMVGRADHDIGGLDPEVDLNNMPGSDTVSRIHATIEHIGSTYTLTDLNSTNSTRINGKRLEPDKATPIKDGDTLHFGKVTCTFKQA